MITVVLDNKTEIKYHNFDEIIECDYNEIIKLDCSYNRLTELPPTIINLRNIDDFKKDDSLKLSNQQKQYFEWIKLNKITVFDEYCDTTLIKYANFGLELTT